MTLKVCASFCKIFILFLQHLVLFLFYFTYVDSFKTTALKTEAIEGEECMWIWRRRAYVIGLSHGELARFTAHDPVCSGRVVGLDEVR